MNHTRVLPLKWRCKDMGFHIIVAHDSTLGIGKHNQIPWYIPSDLKWFRKITTYSHSHSDNPMDVLIMGRKTWESIPDTRRPLKNRINLVVSTSLPQLHEAWVVPNFEQALAHAYKYRGNSGNSGNIFVIGGGRLYNEAMQHPDKQALLLTTLQAEYACDTFFPRYDEFTNCEILTQQEHEGITFQHKICYASHDTPSLTIPLDTIIQELYNLV